jgi:hypothetical protein
MGISFFFLALQFDSHPSGHWHALGATGLRLRRLVYGDCSYYNLWWLGLLYVGFGYLASFLNPSSSDVSRAKILARIICSDPRLRTYTDIGRKAFGPRATVVISCMFCLELFAVRLVKCNDFSFS